MLATALIVFREVFEAALVVSIVMAACKGVAGRNLWIAVGVAAGLCGAMLVAMSAAAITQAVAGIGQELLNAAILFIAVVMLSWHSVWMSRHGQQLARRVGDVGQAVSAGTRPLYALALVIATAVLREGAETVLFVAGSVTGAGPTSGLLLGGALGLAGGVVVGVFTYAGLSRIPTQRLFAATNVLIALLAAAIASQLAKALTQSGLVERWSTPLWDSSALLSGDSALGAVLHALLGYDARPSGVQLMFYVAVLALIFAGTRLVTRQLSAARVYRSSSS